MSERSETAVVDGGIDVWIVRLDASAAGGVMVDLYIDKKWQISMSAKSVIETLPDVIRKVQNLQRDWVAEEDRK